MFPYLTHALVAWGQAAPSPLNKLLLLQKSAIHFMNFPKPQTHVVPLFISSQILPINMLYFETMSNLMYNISDNSAPPNVSRLFRKSSLIHPYKTTILAKKSRDRTQNGSGSVHFYFPLL